MPLSKKGFDVNNLRRISPVVWSLITAFLLLLAVPLNVWDDLRGGYGWRWGYDVPANLGEWLPTLASVLLYATGCLWLMRRAKRSVGWILAWAFLGAALLPFVFLTRWGDPLYLQFTRVASGGTSGPHLIANNYTPDTIDDILKHWTDEQKHLADTELTIHAALAPPGLPLMYYEAGRALQGLSFVSDPIGRTLRPMQCHNLDVSGESNAELAAASVGMTSPLWAALAIFPLFWLARGVLTSEAARWAALLWALVPGVAVFTPVPNTFFPTLAVLCVALLWYGLDRRSPLMMLIAGVVASILTFLNISVVPLLLLCGLLALAYYTWIGRKPASALSFLWLVGMGAIFAVGLASLWLLWALYGGPPFWEILRTAMAQHLELERPYLPWLFLHLWDYALFLGLPLMFLGLATGARVLSKIRRREALVPAALLVFSLGLALLIVDLSGTARGETGRVWQFFFPLSVIAAVWMLQGESPQHWRWLLGVQAAAVLVIALFIPVIGTGLQDPPQQPPSVTEPQITVEANTRFGDSLRLTGLGGGLDTAGDLVVDLRWAADDWSDQPYWFSIIPVTPEGSPFREGFVYQPFEDAYPATCWQPGQTVIERVTVPLEVEAPAGDWWLSVSVHDYTTFEPVTVTMPDGTQGTQAGVGPLKIED
jgi:hypothetical protein